MYYIIILLKVKSMPKEEDISQAISILGNTKDLAKVSVSSISGGKTSAYMALKYPTDVNIFALVLTDDPLARFEDKSLEKAVQERIPHFVATRELEDTVKSVFELEQLLGKEIKFIASPKTLDQVIREKKWLPNRSTRFCTQELKLKPIFEYCYLNLLNPIVKESGVIITTPVEMNIGFRYDEPQRVFKSLGAVYSKDLKGLDWSKSGGCDLVNFQYKCDIDGKFKNKHRIQKTLDWRFKQFPLFVDKVQKEDIAEFWKNKPKFCFPKVSNCDFCFFHRGSEMLEQRIAHPERAVWWLQQEYDSGGYMFGKKPFAQILNEQSAKHNADALDEEIESSCNCTD